jgi:hypothetical protein
LHLDSCPLSFTYVKDGNEAAEESERTLIRKLVASVTDDKR